MSVVFDKIFFLILLASSGFALCKTGIADHKQAKLLSVLEIYLFLPANSLKTYSANFTVQYFQKNYYLILVSLAVLAVVIVLADLVARRLTDDPYRRNVYRYSLIFSNYGLIGYAVTADLFGELVLQDAMVFAFPMGLCAYTLGYSMLSKTGLNLKKLINPPVIAILIGAIMGLAGIQMPSAISTTLEKAAACMSPIGMVLAGMVISEFDIRALLRRKSDYIVVLCRLILFPCAIAGTLALLGLDDVVVPALMMYAMPCGMNTIIVPRLIGEDCESGAALALISNILACATIPLCVSIFT